MFVVSYRNLKGEWIHPGWDFRNKMNAIRFVFQKSDSIRYSTIFRIEKATHDFSTGTQRLKVVWEGK